MKSFLQGKKSLALEGLRLPPGAAPALSPRCDSSRHPGGVATPGGSSAHVEVVKEGDKIVRLIVNCVCGERVEIDCLYPAGR
ncbi:MAG: hypothetical protein B9S34_04610 [Opitutia bacterium Tous-C1TDCM]|nr:MAG: hypothetical protein B9S34_04610 [Opitutae bacterium Tous-C1TDCM]